MKKLLFLFAICLCSLTFASPLQERKIDPTALFNLASTLGVPMDKDLIAETQKRWLRKSSQERWEIAELLPDQRTFVLNWAKEQGLFDAWKPSCASYDKALILGATTSLMQTRLEYLKQLWNEGLRFNQIVWLTGERPLDPRVDGLTDCCNDEAGAARVIWEEANLPEEMRKLRVVFVAVPMKKAGKSIQRPNTEDTIVAWLDIAPEPCKALFVSDQPFCGYQFAVVKASLPDTFQFDVVGRGVEQITHPAAAAITLDSIARWIYQESLSEPSRLMKKEEKKTR